jgi:hypothetical protein
MDAPVAVSVRRGGPEKEPDCSDWGSVSVDLLAQAAPWRTFRWYHGQRHYSGMFWSATEQDHVIYESRLELTRVLFADFDPAVSRIVAQPFRLETVVAGAVRRHIPDYLLLSEQGPVVVDVKPRRRLADEKVASVFAWTRAAVEARGWRYEVWSEPAPTELENVRFLAGYRRTWLFDPDLVGRLRETDLDGALLTEAFRCLQQYPRDLVRSTVLHLLWRQQLHTDLSRPLSGAHILRRAA